MAATVLHVPAAMSYLKLVAVAADPSYPPKTKIEFAFAAYTALVAYLAAGMEAIGVHASVLGSYLYAVEVAAALNPPAA
jgi:hypothetical protein